MSDKGEQEKGHRSPPPKSPPDRKVTKGTNQGGNRGQGSQRGDKQDSPQPPGFQMGRALKTSLGWMAIILVAFLLASIFSSDSSVKEATFTELEE